MIIVNISYEAPKDSEAIVRSILDAHALHDPQFNGASFDINRDEQTWIDAESYPDQGAINALYTEILEAIT